MNGLSFSNVCLAGLVVVAAGCAGSSLKEEFVPTDPSDSTASTTGARSSTGGEFSEYERSQTAGSSRPTSRTLRVSTGHIKRSSILPALDAGLGRFLQGVRVDAVQKDGRFFGFRVRALYPNDPRFRVVDLLPGDIVTAVNTLPIERPDMALRAFESLRTAPALIVDYLRGDTERRLNFTIVD